MKALHYFLKAITILCISAMVFTITSCSGNGERNAENEVADQEPIEEIEVTEENEFANLSAENNQNQWDADESGRINEDEWSQGWSIYMTDYKAESNIFSDWDLDNDSELDDKEFINGMFNYWDENLNGGLENVEFNQFISGYYFDRWNVDKVEGITEIEFKKGWGTYVPDKQYDQALFDKWDLNKDQSLDENELSQGLFTYADNNKNKLVEPSEYQNYFIF